MWKSTQLSSTMRNIFGTLVAFVLQVHSHNEESSVCASRPPDIFGAIPFRPFSSLANLFTHFMQNDQTKFSRTQNDCEVRAAVDVMFEALSHIQASINASESEAREKQYQTFKEALYERFEHLLEQQYALDASSDSSSASCDAAPAETEPDRSSEDSKASGKDAPSGERFDRPSQDVSGDGAADPASLDASESHSEAPSASEGDTFNGDAFERAEETAGPDEEANTLWPSS